MNKIKVLLRSPILVSAGYGHHARTIFRALRKYEHVFDIYLEGTPWGQCGSLWEDTEERRYIDQLLGKTQLYNQQGGTYDIFIHNTVPNEFQKRAPISIGASAGIESTKIAPEWINPSNQMDKIIAVSNHAKYAMDMTTYEAVNNATGEKAQARIFVPIDVVGYPALPVEPKEISLNLKDDFNFLIVAQWNPRKKIEQTIRWFVEKFRNEEVGLVVKTALVNNSIIDRAYTETRMRELLSQFPDRKCSVYLLHGDFSDQEMSGLYQHPKIKALISLAVEGFGLPIFEAAYYGLPIITTEWGGQVDFMYFDKKDKKTGKIKKEFGGTEVAYDIRPIEPEAHWPGMLVPDSMWSFPRENHFKQKIKEVYDTWGAAKKKAKVLQERVLKDFDADKIYEQLACSIFEYADLFDKVINVGELLSEENKIKEMTEVVTYE